jgi:hypothetical protein
MKVENRLGHAFAALALIASLSLPAHAQIGTGWLPIPISVVTVTSAGSTVVPSSTGIGGVFQVPIGQGRATDRIQNFPFGLEQFQGDMTVNSLGGDRIAVKATFMAAPSTPWILIGIQKANGGSFYELEGNAVLSPYAVGTVARINTIVSAGPNVTNDVYINGSLVEQKLVSGGPFFDEFGVWTAFNGTGPATVTWQNVQVWTSMIPSQFSLSASAITASTFQSPNVPANTVDGNLATRWSAQGDPQWIQYDLGSVNTVNFVQVAVYQGDTRVQTFDLQTSSDGTNFTTVAAGLKSSGTTTALETYNLPSPASARFVRLLCHGNSVSNWNSLTEVEIWGSNTPPPLLPPTNVMATNVTSTSATISWTPSASPGVIGYNYSVTGFSFPPFSPMTTGTSFSLTSLTPGTTYSVTVTAVGAASHFSAPATFNFTTLPSTVVLQPPTNLTVSNITSSSATASWTASVSPGVTGYNVEVIPSNLVVTPAVTSSGNPNPVVGTSTSFTNLAPNTSYDVNVYAIDGLGHSSVPATTTFTTLALVNRTLTGSSGDGWHALAISPAASGLFVASFDATPTVSPENAVIGLSSGAATAYGNVSCIARFNPTGQIDAYNGTGYAAAASINYSAGVTYHFRMAVNVTAHTYTVYVTAPGGVEQIVGSNYAFRSTANTVTSLDHWNLDLNATPSGCSLTATNLTP